MHCSSSLVVLLQGQPFLDPQTGTAHAVAAEYAAARGDTWSSKDMLQLIRRKSQVPCLQGLGLDIPSWPILKLLLLS